MRIPRHLLRWLAFLATFASGFAQPRAFEATLEAVDPAWSWLITPGDVLTGQFEVRSGEGAPQVQGVSVIIDRFHVLLAQTDQATPGSQGIDEQPLDDGRAQRQLYAALRPLPAQPPGTQAFLSLVFPPSDPADDVPLDDIVPEGVTVRLVLALADGTYAYATGPAIYLGPLQAPLSPDEEVAALQAVVADLSARLQAQTARADDLAAEVERHRARVASLNRTIDLLIDERAQLQDDLRRRPEQPPPPDADRVHALEADLALARQALADSEKSRQALADLLAQTQRDREDLQGALDAALRDQTDPPPPPPTAPKIGVIRHVEYDPIVVYPPEPPPPSRVVPVVRQVAVPSEPERSPARGPRKVR